MAKLLFEEIIAKNFPNVGRIPRSKKHRVPNMMNPKRSTPRHIVIKMAKVKDKGRILKVARETELVTCKEKLMRLSADFSARTRPDGDI